jgi:hypothetical protein
MAQTVKVIPVELTELRAASTASGGTALTTTLALISIPFGSDYLSITPRNFSGAAVARVALNPYLTIFTTTDGGATAAAITDISDETQDGDAVDIVLDSFPAAGTGYFYVGAPIQFRGVAVTQGTSPQEDATVLTVNYWNGGTWTDTSATDGTDDAGDSMKSNGNVTWTVPAAWVRASLQDIGETLPGGNSVPNKGEPMYWTRWEWTNAFNSNTDVRVMRSLNRSTAYAEYIEGQAVEVKTSNRQLACVEALTDAGTANLVVNVGSLLGSEFD